MTKKKNKSTTPVRLTPNQIGHLVWGSSRNLIDLKIHEDEEGIKLLFIMECIVPEECIPVDQVPETEEEVSDIVSSHMLFEVSNHIEAVISLEHDDGKQYRGFSTGYLNQDNIANFLNCLSDLDDYWISIDQRIEDDENFTKATEGKNLVRGNETVN